MNISGSILGVSADDEERLENILADLKVEFKQQNRNMLKVLRTNSQIMTTLLIAGDRLMTLRDSKLLSSITQ